MMTFENELQNLGLSEKEVLVYLAALELGPETVQNLAQKSGINRATTYLQIKSLKEKGLMSEFEKGKKTFFAAESPEQLSRLINVWEKELDFKRAEVNRILPALKDLFAGAGERPIVRFFEGMEGTKTLQAEFLNVKDKQIESFANLDKLFTAFPKHEEDFTKKRIERGIQSNVIYTRKEGPIENATDPKQLRVAKYIAPEKFPIGVDMTIFDNKIAIVAYRTKPIGIMLEGQEIADTFRAMFYLIWESIK